MPVTSRGQLKLNGSGSGRGKNSYSKSVLDWGPLLTNISEFLVIRQNKSEWTVITIIDASMINSSRVGVKLLFLLPQCAVTILPSPYIFGQQFHPSPWGKKKCIYPRRDVLKLNPCNDIMINTTIAKSYNDLPVSFRSMTRLSCFKRSVFKYLITLI